MMPPYRNPGLEKLPPSLFASTATNPLTIGIHLNHGTSIDDLQLTGFDYSVN